MPNPILVLFPTAEQLLEASELELEQAVLLRVVDYCADPLHRMITRDVVSNEFFEFGGYE
jgi:hypothetical protein